LGLGSQMLDQGLFQFLLKKSKLNSYIRRTGSILWVSAAIGGLIALRWVFPERPFDYVGTRAMLDGVFALGLLGVVLLLAAGLGSRMLRWMKVEDLSSLETALFAVPIGLGIIAYGVLALGLAGLLQSWSIFIWLLLLWVWAWRELKRIADRFPASLRDLGGRWLGLRGEYKAFSIITSIILIATVVQCLAPPVEPDALIYHLQAPRLFLQAGGIAPMPDFTPAAFPFTIEMLFTLGLSFGSDTFAKLIHLSYGIFLVLGVFAAGKHYLSAEGGGLSAAILLTMPILPVWASLAYVDLGWALYEFLALYAIIGWGERQKRGWLYLSGLFMGLALGSKYLASGGAAVLGLWILWQSRGQGGRTVLLNGAVFGFTALLVASPWYLKNWLWYSNPVYPFLEGVTGQGSGLLKLESGGNVFGLWDYLLLPLNLYIHRESFAGVYGSIEILSLLFPLVFLLPWIRKSRILSWFALLTLFRFIFWAVTSHDRIRYLLPAFPALCLLSSHVLGELATQRVLIRWKRVLQLGLVGGLVATTMVYTILFLLQMGPLPVVLGLETKDGFLRRELLNYPAHQYIMNNLPQNARVFTLWDGRAYYCDLRCFPDFFQAGWTRLVQADPEILGVAAGLQEMGVTHLLLSREDLEYKLNNDRTGSHRMALTFFLDRFSPSCAREIYHDDWSRLYEFTCSSKAY
jgi:hypothetical protein